MEEKQLPQAEQRTNLWSKQPVVLLTVAEYEELRKKAYDGQAAINILSSLDSLSSCIKSADEICQSVIKRVEPKDNNAR